MTSWNGPIATSPTEDRILRLSKRQKLWSFLRLQRHQLLDEEIRGELSSLYTDSVRGRPPECPEQLLLAMLLQVAFDVPDHEVPTLTAVDQRWQMVLDCLGTETPLFSQGTVFNFRERVRQAGLMTRLLEKTVMLARESKGFSHKRLRAMFDSSPLLGAGRVEDTFNLLGRSIGTLAKIAATESGTPLLEIASDLDLDVVGASSVKASLDIDWRLPKERAAGLAALARQFRRLQQWIQERFSEAEQESPPLVYPLQTARRVLEQNTEPDPDPDPTPSTDGDKSVRIRQGTAKDRQISFSDPDMRHGRKSSSKTFTGYKRHIAVDADVPGLICAATILKGNTCEHDGVDPLLASLDRQAFDIQELHIDRGYLPAEKVRKMHKGGTQIISKPSTPRSYERFGKHEFSIDFTAKTITCPAGTSLPIKADTTTIRFPSRTCRSCESAARCVPKKNVSGRVIRLHPEERWYREMTQELSTSSGRKQRRARIPVEHTLARVGAIQRRTTRFRGQQKNQFELERVAVVNNLYVLNKLAA